MTPEVFTKAVLEALAEAFNSFPLAKSIEEPDHIIKSGRVASFTAGFLEGFATPLWVHIPLDWPDFSRPRNTLDLDWKKIGRDSHVAFDVITEGALHGAKRIEC